MVWLMAFDPECQQTRPIDTLILCSSPLWVPCEILASIRMYIDYPYQVSAFCRLRTPAWEIHATNWLSPSLSLAAPESDTRI